MEGREGLGPQRSAILKLADPEATRLSVVAVELSATTAQVYPLHRILVAEEEVRRLTLTSDQTPVETEVVASSLLRSFSNAIRTD